MIMFFMMMHPIDLEPSSKLSSTISLVSDATNFLFCNQQAATYGVLVSEIFNVILSLLPDSRV